MTNPFVNEPTISGLSGRWVDGRVTSVAPLLVRLDGYAEEPQPPTKPPLVAGLVVGDRVRCQLEGRQLIVFGRYGG